MQFHSSFALITILATAAAPPASSQSLTAVSAFSFKSELPTAPSLPSLTITHPPFILLQSIDVRATGPNAVLQSDDATSLRVSSESITTAAGAWSDIPRFLQTLPGVAFDSDARNTYLVNGGNAIENLFLLDGVEIPSINHISTAASTGGFVSIIDTDVVSSINLHKQLYGSQYSGTLSSVLEVNTLAPRIDATHAEINLGYAGASALMQQPIFQRGTLVTQVRLSLDNYVTSDIGLGGVPSYRNILSTDNFALGPHDSLRTLFLNATDQLTMATNIDDWANPSLVNTAYHGNHTTAAITWHHESATGGHDLQVNQSHVATATTQVNSRDGGSPVYSDQLSEDPITLKLDLYRTTRRLDWRTGTSLSAHTIDYAINQATGFPSPYSLDPSPVNASNIHVTGTPINAALYAEATLHVSTHLDLLAGTRLERWGINKSAALMPRLNATLTLTPHATLFGGIGSYSQMPAMPILLGVAQNIALKPIRDIQTQLGTTLTNNAGDKLTASLYTRSYSSYPVSTEFPTLSLANLVDPFGLPNLYMPMVSSGTGTVHGAEIHIQSSLHRRLFGQANLTTISVRHTALDGISHPAAYDSPLSANLTGGIHLSHSQLFTGRYSFHSGTPYTPFLLAASLAQNREIFDLSQVDAQRAPSYARLDLRYEANFHLGHKNLKLFAGLENVLNKSNVYQYVLLPGDMAYGPYALTQMSRTPDAGLVWSY